MEVYREEPLIKDDTSERPTRENILALSEDLVDTVNNTLRVVTYEQLKPAILTFFDGPDYVLDDAGRLRHHESEIRRLLDVIGDTSISSERWGTHAGELKHAIREYFREQDLSAELGERPGHT